MAVKLSAVIGGKVPRLRVVLSHMAVKHGSTFFNSGYGLRVVLSHMAVKRTGKY